MKLLSAIPALPVVNIDKAVMCYRDRFHFVCRHQDEGFAIFVRNEVEIHLWAACDYSWKWRSILLFLSPVWSGAESFLAGTASCRIEVENIESFYKEYEQTGVLYREETSIDETSWGKREFPTLDLHRNLLTFYEHI